jgi:putative spermidine/putrescine transport system substrate-binding protein
VTCHNQRVKTANLALDNIDADHISNSADTWEKVVVKLRSRAMPPPAARRPDSALDMVWINGETFYQLRQIGALDGPFTSLLPNARWIDWENRFMRYDFQQEIDGFECPWGNVQFALIYDSKRVPEPPRTRAALGEWVEAHPGRFTFDVQFTGLTFLKALLIDFAGGEEALAGPFDETKYRRHSAALWDWLNAHKQHFWKRGRTFPDGVAQLHKLFASGEVDFTMSNNDGEVDNKVLLGLFPESARAYVLDTGTIQNSHYLGIVKRAPHRDAALVAVNFLISPEAQLEKGKPSVWGDGTILDVRRLPEEWKAPFAAGAARRYGPQRSEIQPKALMELAPEYMLRLHQDFRTHVIDR